MMHWFAIFSIGILSLFTCEKNAHAQLIASEQKLLAAYILNIIKFVEFKNLTADNQNPIRIDVLSNSDLANELKAAVDGKIINNRPLEVFPIDSAKITRPHQMVVLIPKSNEDFKKNLEKLKGCNCLTVSYSEGLGTAGVAINFFSENDRLRFEINTKTAKEENIEISSQLLRLARIID